MVRISGNVKWLVAAAGMLSPFALLSASPMLVITGIWLPVLLGLLLWREDEIPVLLFVFMLQWLEVFTGVFYSVVRGIPMDALFGGPELANAVLLAALALLVGAVGARLGLIGTSHRSMGLAHIEAAQLSVGGAWWLFAAALVLAEVAVRVSGFSGQIRQLALALSGVEQVAFFVLAYVVLSRRQGYRLLAVAAAIEIGAGIGGFFADFKLPLFVLFLVAVSVISRITFARLLGAMAIVAVAVLMGIVWSAIKLEYRDYVSGYTGAQVLLRPWDERVGFLASRVMDLDSYDLADGVEKLASRVSYVEFFGYALRRIPNHMPHENGRIVRASVEHIFKPRLFFPDKPALEDDTAKTERYTGIFFHSARQTSIGLGYITEAYIDFGRYGMYVPILLLGLMWGLIYRFFIIRRPGLFGAALAFPVLVNTAQVGLGFNKVLGGTLTSFGVMALVAVFVVPRVLPYLRQRPTTGEAPVADQRELALRS